MSTEQETRLVGWPIRAAVGQVFANPGAGVGETLGPGAGVFFVRCGPACENPGCFNTINMGFVIFGK